MSLQQNGMDNIFQYVYDHRWHICWNSNRQLPFVICPPRNKNFYFPFAANKLKFTITVFRLLKTNESLWRACNLTAFTHSSTGPVVHSFASRHEGPVLNPQGGFLCETGILLLALSRYIGYPDVNDHCGLVWGGIRPEPSLGRHANNVIIPLDLTQLFCPGLIILPASQPT